MTNMDKRLQITDSPREVVSGVVAETPLVTVAWRALRTEYQRRSDERMRAESEAKQVQNALVNIAEEVHRLRRVVRLVLPDLEKAEKDSHAQQLLSIAARLEETLASLDVTIVAPEDEPYTAELMELLDNIAQQPEQEAHEPRVAEVITPAVMYRGAVLRMGKAVIAVPIRPDAASAVETEEGEQKDG